MTRRHTALPTAFRTDRLSVAHWAPDLSDPDRRAALETALDAALTEPVLHPLPPPLWRDRGANGIGDWIDARAAESDVFTVRDHEDGMLLGLLILAAPEGETVHLGYLLAEAAWGRGLASELVAGLVDAAPDVPFVGGVAADNPASARVLVKAGFVRDPELSGARTDVYVRRPR